MGTSKNSKIGDKMKIRYISNFTDGTDWSQHAIYNVLHLNSMGYDVYCSKISYNNANILNEDSVEQMLNKSQNEPCDITIQHILPYNYIKYSNTKNIGFFPVDSTIRDLMMVKKINLMDEMLVPSKESKTWMRDSGFELPVNIFYRSFDYEKVINFQNKLEIPQLEGKFTFGFINEFSKQKNLEAAMRAFYSEFSHSEPVNMLVHVDKDTQTVSSFSKEVKMRMRKGSDSRDEIIATGEIKGDDALSLLSNCHALIVSSYAESTSQIILEACAMGIPIVHTRHIGVASYLDPNASIPVRAQRENCYGAIDGLTGLYTDKDEWMSINHNDLKQAMRFIFNEYYSNPDGYKKFKDLASKKARLFDYRNKKVTEEWL
jgi:glycosyltransferase involved in cell wall biosynthesis